MSEIGRERNLPKMKKNESTHLLIRGSRNHQGHCWRNPPNGAAMSDWQTWQETA
jgi:hypothetical protein